MAKGLRDKGSGGQINKILAIKDPPYQPSWLDRLNAWVERLPISSFLVYLLFYFTLAFLDQLIGAIEGYRPFGENLQQTLLYPLFAFEAFYYIYLSYGYCLDALANFQALLNVPRQHFQKLEYEFAILPAVWVNTLTIIAILSSVAVSFFSPALFGISVKITVVYILGQTLSWLSGLLAIAILVYRLVRQTRMVNRIYKLVVNVDLYNLGPIYALSSFMGKASLILLLILYSNLVSDPNNLQISGFLQGSVAISFVALAGFVLPLIGINRRLVAAKATLMQEAGSQVKSSFERLNKEQATKTLANISNTRQLVDAVIRKREFIESIPTWPWQAGTLRNLLLGVFLPLLIWTIQQVLLRTVVN